jgi:hypothetical protein
MKIIVYYIVLLVFVALLSGFVWAKGYSSMTMPEMLGICVALAVYVVAMSLVGEGKATDERDSAHRYASARAALVVGTIFLSLAVVFQLLTHQLDYWLLAGLIVLNLTKILSLIYLNYKR